MISVLNKVFRVGLKEELVDFDRLVQGGGSSDSLRLRSLSVRVASAFAEAEVRSHQIVPKFMPPSTSFDYPFGTRRSIPRWLSSAA
jgi:hypothetical protein